MIKVLVMVECNLCHATLPRALTLTNRSEIPHKQLQELLIEAEQSSWQSQNALTEHMCDECCNPDPEYRTRRPKAFIPF